MPRLTTLFLFTLLSVVSVRAEDAKPADAKPDEAKVNTAKTEVPKVDGEMPKAPDGKPILNKDGETLAGKVSLGGGKDAKEKGKKKTGDKTLVLHVGGGGKNKDKTAEKRTVTLIATGDILTQLTALAEKHASVRVTGTLTGDSMTVNAVVEDAGKPKKNKNNV